MNAVEGANQPFAVRSFKLSALLELLSAGAAAGLVFALPGKGYVTGAEAVTTGFFCLMALALSRFGVRVARGQLGLMIIATEAAAMILRPSLVLVVALVASLCAVGKAPRGARHAGFGLRLAWVLIPAVAASLVPPRWHEGGLVPALIVIVGTTFLNWALTILEMRVITGEPVHQLLTRSFSPEFFGAFVYFGLASFLIAGLVGGAGGNYLLASIVPVLSIKITETINQQRRRQAAEAQLVDVHRHTAYQRAVAGLVHNLRNTVSLSKSYLEDLEELNGTNLALMRIAGAKRAADESLGNLARWSQAANPKLEVAAENIDLVSIADERLDAVRLRASRSRIEITRRAPATCPVRADPLQIGDVITNLLLNAIDAVGAQGRIVVTVSSDRSGGATLSVADNGPGIPREQRDKLFAPDFTTKSDGSGIGLFTSFGIVRQHGGELRYQTGEHGGAIFTIVLPARSPLAPEPVTKAGNGLDPAAVAERLASRVDSLVD